MKIYEKNTKNIIKMWVIFRRVIFFLYIAVLGLYASGVETSCVATFSHSNLSVTSCTPPLCCSKCRQWRTKCSGVSICYDAECICLYCTVRSCYCYESSALSLSKGADLLRSHQIGPAWQHIWHNQFENPSVYRIEGFIT